jgi:hypothetical protein
VPWLRAPEASVKATERTEGLSSTAASWAFYYCAAVSCSAPLETLVLSDNDVLLDCVVRLKLLSRDIVFDIVSFVLLVALILHAFDLCDSAALDVRSYVIFDALITEAVIAEEGQGVSVCNLIVADLARLYDL